MLFMLLSGVSLANSSLTSVSMPSENPAEASFAISCCSILTGSPMLTCLVYCALGVTSRAGGQSTLSWSTSTFYLGVLVVLMGLLLPLDVVLDFSSSIMPAVSPTFLNISGSDSLFGVALLLLSTSAFASASVCASAQRATEARS